MKSLTWAAFAAVAIAAPAAAQTVTYNSAPAGGFLYGSGNNYTPANAAVLTGGLRPPDNYCDPFGDKSGRFLIAGWMSICR